VLPEPDLSLAPLSEPPKISVVVPVYQAAHMVGDAIKSILAQTVSPHEIIVCDDGSTDDLAASMAPFAEQVTFLHQEHKGVAAARNLGTFCASGEFVAVCDADDLHLPRLIEAFGELAMARPDLDILSRACFIERHGKPAGFSRTPDNPRFPVGDQRRAILSDNFVPSASAVRRKRVVDIGGYDETLQCASDYDMWLRLIIAGSRAGLLLEPLAVYRDRDESVSKHDLWCIRGRITAFTKILDNGDLSDAERVIAEGRLAFHHRDLRRAAVIAEAKRALVEGHPDARRRSLRAAIGKDQSLRTRLRAGLAVFAPRWAGSRTTYLD
jgi:glycosyltransferase involved in cell wall biosynthesis